MGFSIDARWRRWAAVVILAALPASVQASTTAEPVAAEAGQAAGHGTIGSWTRARPPEEVCLAEAAAAERRAQVPPGLVRAIALAESGRWDTVARRSYAWPWTVTAGDQSWYLGSKAEAVAHVRELQRAGRTNIDVGCMQINLHWHPDAFATLEDAFDPRRNVAYGVEFLKSLRSELRSWGRAVARYHTADEARGDAYRERVTALWTKQRLLRAEELRQAFAEARAARRAAVLSDRPTGAVRSGGVHLRWFAADRGRFVPVEPSRPPPGAPVVLRGADGRTGHFLYDQQQRRPRPSSRGAPLR
jgi:soluble lytic murein transglycosylase-like protein